MNVIDKHVKQKINKNNRNAKKSCYRFAQVTYGDVCGTPGYYGHAGSVNIYLLLNNMVCRHNCEGFSIEKYMVMEAYMVHPDAVMMSIFYDGMI